MSFWDTAGTAWGRTKDLGTQFLAKSTKAFGRVGASVITKMYELRYGERPEKYIVELLQSYLELDDLVITHNGPIDIHVHNVGIKPALVAELRRDTGLIMDRMQSRIGQLQLQIDFEQFIMGQQASHKVSDEPDSMWMDTTEDCFIKLGIAVFALTAPGVWLTVTDARVVIHAEKPDDSPLPPLQLPRLNSPVLRSPRGMNARRSETPSSPGSPGDDGVSEDGYLNDILFGQCSKILMGLKIHVHGMRAAVDARDQCFPGSRVALQVVFSLKSLRVEHLAFYGAAKVQHEHYLLTNQRQALMFHLRQMPLHISMDHVRARLGQVMEFSCIGCPHSAGQPDVDLTLEHDEFASMRIVGHIWNVGLKMGSILSDVVLQAEDQRGQPVLQFTVGNMVDKIPANRMLRRHLNQNPRAEASKLNEIENQLQLAREELESLSAARREQGAQREEPSSPAEDELCRMELLKHQIEMHLAEQERFYEKLFWSELELTLGKLFVLVDPHAFTEVYCYLCTSLMSWLADADTDHDGQLSREEFEAAANAHLRGSLDIDGDGLLDEQELSHVFNPRGQEQQNTVEAKLTRCVQLLRRHGRSDLGRDLEQQFVELDKASVAATQQVLAFTRGMYADMVAGNIGTMPALIEEAAPTQVYMPRESFALHEILSSETSDPNLSFPEIHPLDRQEIAETLHELAQAAERSKSRLQGHVRRPRYGIRLNLDLALPTLRLEGSRCDGCSIGELDLHLGHVSMQCPADINEYGAEIPVERRLNHRVRTEFSQMSCTVTCETDEGNLEPHEIILMPVLVVAVAEWSLVSGCAMLLPQYLKKVSVDVFAYRKHPAFHRTNRCNQCGPAPHSPSGGPSTDAAFMVDLAKDVHLSLYLLMREVSQKVSDAVSTGANGEFLRWQNLYEHGIRLRQLYKKWVLPVQESVHVQLTVKCHFRVGFVLQQHSHKHDCQSCQPGPTKDTEAILSCLCDGMSICLASSRTTSLSFTKLRVVAKLDRLKAYAEALETAMDETRVASDCPRNSPDMEHKDEPRFSRTRSESVTSVFSESSIDSNSDLEVCFEAPPLLDAPQTAGGEESCVQVRFILKHRAVDGISITLPALSIHAQCAELLVLRARALQLRYEGITTTSMCRSHFDSKMAWAWNHVYGTVRKAEQWEETVSEEDVNQFRHAIDEIHENNLQRADLSAGESSAMVTTSVIIGQVDVTSEVSGQVITWFQLYSTTDAPLWVVRSSLASPKALADVQRRLTKLQGGIPTQIDHLVSDVQKALTAVENAAVDYHDFNFQGCTMLTTMSGQALGALKETIKGVIRAKPENNCPDWVRTKLKNTRFDAFNLWPTMGFWNRTGTTLGVSGYDWKWNSTRRLWFWVRFGFWYSITMDMLPALIAAVAFLSYLDEFVDTFGDHVWLFFFYQIPTVLYSCFYFPSYCQAVTSKWSRMYGFAAGMSGWWSTLWWRSVGKETFLWGGADHPFSSGNWHNFRVDFAMVVVLFFSGLAKLWSRCDEASQLESGNLTVVAPLRAPISHRYPVLLVGGVYFITFGVVETATATLVSGNSGDDCNRTVLVVSGILKLVTGLQISVVSTLICAKKAGSLQNSAWYSDYQANSTEDRLLRRALVVKQQQDHDHLAKATWVYVFLNGGLLGLQVILAIVASTMVPDTSKWLKPQMSSGICLLYSCNANLATMIALWGIFLMARKLHQFLQMESEEARKSQVKNYQSTLLHRLTELALPRLEIPPEWQVPPPRDADDEAWVEWIKRCQVRAVTLLEKLGPSEGGQAAAKYARLALYGRVREGPPVPGSRAGDDTRDGGAYLTPRGDPDQPLSCNTKLQDDDDDPLQVMHSVDGSPLFDMSPEDCLEYAASQHIDLANIFA